ncbi:sulfite exporter TauE/SafE family protein [Bacillus sp. FJAT-44742]|uniref:sulfite exporter TauE/SafE family protein n=1 Tax=Bacillus sp. FJAT-44742 TaxID=2014005 RepID=UPI000C243082|nr:sulfite exporter TauE/SafE family protein [Bacillus sp. FJAT-44742]
MEDIILAAIIVLFASMLQACTGFGFSIMATPFLLLVFEPRTAIQINIILSILISIFMVPGIFEHINKGLLKKLIFSSVIGSPFGILIYLYLDVELLKLVISILILVLTILLILKFRIRRSHSKDYVSGGVSGLLTTSIGMPGPPLLLYFTGVSIDKAVLRSTTLAFYLFIYSISLGMQITFGSTSREIWIVSISLFPLMFIGMFAGRWLFKHLSQQVFQVITYIILAMTGFYLLFTSI